MGEPFLFPCDLGSQGWGGGPWGTCAAWRDGDRRAPLREGILGSLGAVSSEQVFPCYGACLSPEDDRVQLLALEPGFARLDWRILEAMCTTYEAGPRECH